MASEGVGHQGEPYPRGRGSPRPLARLPLVRWRVVRFGREVLAGREQCGDAEPDEQHFHDHEHEVPTQHQGAEAAQDRQRDAEDGVPADHCDQPARIAQGPSPARPRNANAKVAHISAPTPYPIVYNSGLDSGSGSPRPAGVHGYGSQPSGLATATAIMPTARTAVTRATKRLFTCSRHCRVTVAAHGPEPLSPKAFSPSMVILTLSSRPIVNDISQA